MNRREFGRVSLGALTVSLAGCGQLDGILGGETKSTPMLENWESFRGDTRRTGRVVPEAGPGESLSVAWHLTGEEVVKAVDDEISSDSMLLNDGTSWPVLADEYLIWMIQHHGREESSFGTQLMAVDPSGSIEWSRKLSYMSGQETTRMYGPRIDDGLLYHPKPARLQLGVDAESDSSPKTMVITVRDPETGDVERELDLGIPAWGKTLVNDGRIFVLTTSEDPYRLSAFDAESGNEEWSVEAPALYYRRSPFGSLSDDALFYFESREEYLELVARNVEDGSVRWRTPLDVAAPYQDYQSIRFQLPTVGDHVYTAGYNIAQWRYTMAPLVALDKDEGTETDRYRPPGFDGDDNLARNRSRATDQSSEGTAAAEDRPPFSGLYGMPLPIDDLVVAAGYGAVEGADDGSRCFAIEDDSIVWSVETERGVQTLVAAGDVIYLTSLEGSKAISKEGDLLDSITYAEHDELSSSSFLYPGKMMPAIGNGLLYVPTETGIAAIE